MGTRVVFYVLGCSLFVNQVKSSEAPSPSPQTPSSPQEIVDSWMAKQPAGAVAVALVSHNSSEFIFAGSLLPKSPSLPDEQTMFEIGSVTKGFTGLLLADLVNAENVSFNNTLSQLLTDWPGRFTSAAGNATLLELATHTSGLTRLPGNMDNTYLQQHATNPYASYKTQDLYAWLDTVQDLRPGNYSYSNAGFGILGHALAVTAGKPFEDLLKERLLTPLELGDTTISLNESQIDRFAPGHNILGSAVQNWDFDVLAPCGALRSSITDLARFLKLVLDDEKNETSFHEALELATRQWGTTGMDHLTIGLGWHRSMDQVLMWHNGATAGFSSFLGWYPEQQKGVGIVASVSMGLSNTVDQLALELLRQV